MISIEKHGLGIYALLVVFGLSACGTLGYDNPEVRRTAAKIVLIEGSVPENTYKLIGEVKGSDCSSNWNRASYDVALRQLRGYAAKLGANAILNVACEDTGFSLLHNCNNSVACYGDAVIMDASALPGNVYQKPAP